MNRQIMLGGAKAIVVAVVVNAVLFLIFHQAGVISDAIMLPNEGGPITLMHIVFSSIMPLVVATLLYLLLARFTNKATRIFRIVAIAFLVLSFITPFNIPGITIGMVLVLNLMHLVAGGSTLYFLPSVNKAL
jgi:hypothetical protein